MRGPPENNVDEEQQEDMSQICLQDKSKRLMKIPRSKKRTQCSYMKDMSLR